jgi:hypothetical protein
MTWRAGNEDLRPNSTESYGSDVTVARFSPRPRADTKQVAALQLLPFLPILIAILGTIPGGWNPTTLAGGVLVTAIVQFFFARADKRNLEARGFVEMAPASLALISAMLYLYVRGRRCDGHDPSAKDAVTWSLILTILALLIGAAGTLFEWGVAGLIQNLSTAG